VSIGRNFGGPVGVSGHEVFTIVDAGHDIEDWTFEVPNGKPVHAHIDPKRVP